MVVAETNPLRLALKNVIITEATRTMARIILTSHRIHNAVPAIFNPVLVDR